ncbi:MAG: endonuclease III domain-containing protein [Eubacteriales bacterium]
MPKIEKIIEQLKTLYPDALCSLTYEGDPWRLLVMARLSAQCTDERVNLVAGPLFEAFPDVYAMAEAEIEKVEALVRPCGLYHTKAESIIAAAKRIVERHEGQVPRTMDELLALPGIGRKIANLVLGDLYGIPGIVADTHCIRINGRIGFYDTDLRDPVKVERILADIVPPAEQSAYCHRMVLFGREYCSARSPRCADCPIADECGFPGKTREQR